MGLFGYGRLGLREEFVACELRLFLFVAGGYDMRGIARDVESGAFFFTA